MNIGAHALRNGVLVAPMAGITDRPFRALARRFGAGMAVGEMVSARPELRASRKSQLRLDHRGETGPIAVQIAGAEPQMLADAARYNVENGAEIIDINMGCPAKKVCNLNAGSALLEDEALVGRILDAVVSAVAVPVTLKIRTGPTRERRNAVRIARIAEAAGIRMLAVHGRTRACAFGGHAEYDSIAEVKARAGIPVVANGDIRTPAEAKRVLELTGADGVMIGRAAHGKPWLFREIVHFLETGKPAAPATLAEIAAVLEEHLEGLYELYGAEAGVRVARKHIGWTVSDLPGGEAVRRCVNGIADARSQQLAVRAYFERVQAAELYSADREERLAA